MTKEENASIGIRYESWKSREISGVKLRLAYDLQSIYLKEAMSEIHPSILRAVYAVSRSINISWSGLLECPVCTSLRFA